MSLVSAPAPSLQTTQVSRLTRNVLRTYGIKLRFYPAAPYAKAISEWEEGKVFLGGVSCYAGRDFADVGITIPDKVAPHDITSVKRVG